MAKYQVRPNAKLPRRINTDADFAMATAVVNTMGAELEALEDLQLRLSRKIDNWTENGGWSTPKELEEFETATKLYQYNDLKVIATRKELLNWALVASNVANKQLETRQKKWGVGQRRRGLYLYQSA